MAAIKFRGLNAVTNFDITRYDVGKIMESNVLLPGDEARKVKAIIEPPSGAWSVMQNSGRELHEEGTEWRMVEAVARTEAQDDPQMGGEPHPSLHGIVGLGVECEAQHDLHDVSGRTGGGGVNLSNSPASSSLVNGSREGSPCPCPADKLGLAMLYSKHANAAAGLATMNPWMQMPAPAASAHMLGPTNVSHLPVFAAWADA